LLLENYSPDYSNNMDGLAIITVNYKNYAVTEAFLQSFKKQSDRQFKIFIIDLSPETQEIASEMDSTEVIRAENKGYAYGLNVGLRTALDAGYNNFACMNNDTEVGENYVKNARDTIKNHPLSLIGGKIYYYAGYEYHKERYSKTDLGNVIWYAGGIIDWKNVFTRHVGVDEIDTGQYDEVRQIEFVTGCLMMFDASFLRTVGMLDETYFMYYEDADWSMRAQRAGLKLYYDPQVVIWHKNAQSTGGAGSDMHIRYQKKNRLKFSLRYAPLRAKLHVVKNHLMGR